jgi:hypothetical protein
MWTKRHRLVALGLAVVVVVAEIGWRWRPPVLVGSSAPAFRVPAAQQSVARALVDSLFGRFGARIDTVGLDTAGRLRLVLHPGAYVQPPRFNGDTCMVGPNAEQATRRLAAAGYRLYSRRQPLNGVVVAFGTDSAVTGGWFHRAVCRSGGGWMLYRPAELDTTS